MFPSIENILVLFVHDEFGSIVCFVCRFAFVRSTRYLASTLSGEHEWIC